MSRTDPLVIVGASAAGAATALALRANGYRGEVVLLGEEKHLPYDRPPLSKGALTGKVALESFGLLSTEEITANQITTLLGRRAVSLDSADQRVTLDDGTQLPYSQLVIATGVRPRTIEAGDRLPNVTTLRTIDDAILLSRLLASSSELVIVGAGFIGLEVAASARTLGVDVHIIEPAPEPIAGRVPSEISQRIRRLHEASGVQFHFGATISEWVEADGRLVGVVLDNGERLSAQVAVIGIGGAPNVDWLEGSGVPLSNGVLCDEENRALESVYAVGDVANAHSARRRAHSRIEHRAIANEHARRVAAAACGTEPPADEIPYFWSDQYSTKLQIHGTVAVGADFDIVEDDPDADRFIAVLRRAGVVEALIGWNAPGRLARLRRELLPMSASIAG